MKKLFVMRHAKSSWDDARLSDFERPLNERGRRTAPLMGKFLREREIVPELIISSPAVRAKQTAEAVKNAAKYVAEIRFDKRIYESDVSTLLYILSETEEKFSSVLIVGHNPAFEYLTAILTGKHEIMPTAAVAKISLKIKNWQEISADCGTLEDFFRPKEIKI